MGLNESKGDMYDFVTHTWNTVKGACPHECSYCYMRRFGKQKPVRFDSRELKTDLGEGNFIFVGSSCDMWAGSIPTQWTVDTLKACERFNNRYLFQSKNPASFGLIPHLLVGLDAVLCTTIETNRWYPAIMGHAPDTRDRSRAIKQFTRHRRHVTIEPILDFDLAPMIELIKICEPVQVNIGADSGCNGLPEPPAGKILNLIDELERFTTVKRKANLSRLLAAKP